MDILSVAGSMVHQHWGDKTLPTSAGEDERYAPEWCYFTSLGPPNNVTRE